MLRIRVAAALAFACLVSFLAPGSHSRAVSPDLVISQVYGGGGNSGAVYNYDFIEIFNRGIAPASLNGMSLQYASATGTGNFGGTSTQLTELPNVTLNPGQYFLVQQATSNAAVGAPIPTPDFIDATPISMSATGGKVVLATFTSSLGCNGGSAPCTGPALARIVDLVGWDGANFYEGSAAAPATTALTAVLRAGNGCIDSDNNATDFTAGAPTPRNTSSLLNACSGSTSPTATGLALPSSVESGQFSLLTVAVTPGANPTSTGVSVTADLSQIGGSSTQAFYDDGSNGDIEAGDQTFSFGTTVTAPIGAKTVTASVTDAQSRSATATIALTVQPPVTPIYTLQGTGSSSPFASDVVSTKGIVTARKSSGFFIQVPDSETDGNEQTSDGIFIFTSSTPPASAALGNEVRVTGTVQEFVPASAPTQPPLTEVVSPSVTVLTTGNTLPTPVTLQPSFTTTTGGLQQLERFEGMRVTADITAITGTEGNVSEPNATSTSNGVFYAVIQGITRPVREPGYDPSETLPSGSPCCVPAFDGNPEKLRVDSDGQVGAPAIEIVTGQSIDGMIGVLDYGFFAYTILPDPGVTYVPEGPSTAIPVTLPGERQFTVASYNLERFFDVVNDPAIGEPVLTAAAFDRRLSKASLAIRNILHTPDVLGLVEIENLSTLEAIANRINADAVLAGDPDPEYVARLEEGNDVGGIDVGFLVKSSRVDIVSVEQIGKATTYFNVESGNNELLNDRPPLVLHAAVHGEAGSTPYPVTVIVNHLRSLNGMTDAGLAGQRVRDKRRAQAEFLASYIQGLQAANPNERIISVGDYNAFQFNDGFVDLIGTIKGAPTSADQVVAASADLVNPNLVNAGDLLSHQAQYSYVFDGNAQAIDHVLMDQAAYKRFSAIEYAHLGADFPESFRNDAARPERLSDHDAAVAYFEFPGAPVLTLLGDPEMTVEAFGAPFVDPGANAYDDDLGALSVSVTGSVDVNTLGTYTLTYSASNGYLTTTKTRIVHVVDTTAPAINDFALSSNLLWPPNHKMNQVAASYTATDGSGTLQCALTVESNEAQNGLGDGDTEVDWLVDSATAVQLRGERSALGTGRVYGVIVSCVDPSNNRASERLTVVVPLNGGRK